MEQHAVPRNISGFQFRLIGDMTLRQFGYLVAGAALAFITYKIAPFHTVFKYILVTICAFLGIAFAFIPIQERPLDRWLTAFIKSIYSPTQYLWRKEGTALEILTRPAVIRVKRLQSGHIQAHRDAKEKLHRYLQTLPVQPHQTLNAREQEYINQTLALFNGYARQTVVKVVTTQATQPNAIPYKKPSPRAMQYTTGHPMQPTTPVPPKSPQEVNGKSDQLASTNIQSSKNDASSKTQLATTPVAASVADQSMQQKLSALAAEKEALEKELARLKQETKREAKPPKEKHTPSPKKKKRPTIRILTAETASEQMGMPKLPQTPNIVLGVIKDAEKKILPNIIITIKDNKNMPVRALKTNKLGQFITATPLPNGTYLLEIEDPLKRYVFDRAKITLSGKVSMPIEVTAKGEKELMREKLTKELFGHASANI